MAALFSEKEGQNDRLAGLHERALHEIDFVPPSIREALGVRYINETSVPVHCARMCQERRRREKTRVYPSATICSNMLSSSF
jgi:hypothetical protein